MKQPAVYIVTNKRNGTLYTGVTSNLPQRIYQHKLGSIEGFTKKYSCKILVYFQQFETMEQAIRWEKIIKSKTRKEKLELIEKKNLEWEDLYSLLSF